MREMVRERCRERVMRKRGRGREGGRWLKIDGEGGRE